MVLHHSIMRRLGMIRWETADLLAFYQTKLEQWAGKMGKHELLESRTVRGVFYLIYLNLMSKKNRKCVRNARNMLQIDVTRFKRVTFSFINYIAILQISIILLVFVKFIKKSRICQNVFNCKLLCSLRALWF